MRNLKIMLVVALGAVLFSSCSKGYGCFYSNVNDQEISPDVTKDVVTTEPVSQDVYEVQAVR